MALLNKSVLNQRVSTYFEFLFVRKNLTRTHCDEYYIRFRDSYTVNSKLTEVTTEH